MADSKIYITISSTTTGSGQSANEQITTGGTNTSPSNEQKPKQAGESNAFYDGVKTILVDAGKKLLSTAISQYGNLTGDTVTASRIQAINQVAGYALAIKAGGWVGAAAVAVDLGIQGFTSFIENRKANAQIEMLRQRAGNATLNGSRYSYD